ncbi:MAG TPA: DUF1858 domain-containing protein [Tepidisphaeraceae bacterium]|nr:DUF1858 domain-containing protein [Tepidisphaeraceae bacterium]
MSRALSLLTPELTIESILDACPEAARVLLRHGMACVGCAIAPYETLRQAANEYALEVEQLFDEIRAVQSERSDKDKSQRRRAGAPREGPER